MLRAAARLKSITSHLSAPESRHFAAMSTALFPTEALDKGPKELKNKGLVFLTAQTPNGACLPTARGLAIADEEPFPDRKQARLPPRGTQGHRCHQRLHCDPDLVQGERTGAAADYESCFLESDPP